jgi:hypothetical protein
MGYGFSLAKRTQAANNDGLTRIPLVAATADVNGQLAMAKDSLVPFEQITKSILLIRGEKVMLDRDLANLYGVPTRVLVQAVKRNRSRFPPDFMFQLSWEEAEQLSRSQFVTLKRGGNIKYAPYAFTEQGVAMLSGVLRSARAIEVNIAIMRAFVRLRELLATHKDLARKLDQLENKLGEHDRQFQVVFEAIRQLMEPPPEEPKRSFGFRGPSQEETSG